ncbi:hypothetical protein [Anaerophaga thermohalophila]|uniref:hypothetical protein n=1 Tax=Anaerophaga thermohalophila TaxID=177400 RepID=UPI000237C4C0|nr:hypothetical protein [Anaerophaga thermohalophila]
MEKLNSIFAAASDVFQLATQSCTEKKGLLDSLLHISSPQGVKKFFIDKSLNAIIPAIKII